MIIHLIDGTYELFRHFYGLRSFNKGKDTPYGAAIGVMNGMMQMIEEGATHLGVATDHVIESFRNDLYPGYKTSSGMEKVLLKQFGPLEDGLRALGITVWAMTELEADDALASAAKLAAKSKKVEKVCIWTPDKDLAQCVKGDRVVQMDRRSNRMRNELAVMEKFGVLPSQIPDFLALVGDTADGYPGISGIGKVSAVRLLQQYGKIEKFPKDILGENKSDALLFKKLATLRADAKLFKNVNELRWTGPTPELNQLAKRFDAPKLIVRADRIWRNFETAEK